MGNPDRFRERRFLTDLARAARQHPGWNNVVDSIVVVSAHPRHTRWPELEQAPGRRFILAIGNENGVVRPELRQAGVAIAQQYVRPSTDDGPPVLPLPLGPGGPEDAPPLARSRDLDVVFIGHLHRHRWPLARRLGCVRPMARWLPDTLLSSTRDVLLQRPTLDGLSHVIAFTRRFGSGRPRPAYLDLLHRAHIALVPRGFKQAETFRHHEAARAGCVLVGTPLPDRRYPVLEPPPDRPLHTWLLDLLSQPHRLEAARAAVVHAWNTRGRPDRVGTELARQVLERLRPHEASPVG